MVDLADLAGRAESAVSERVCRPAEISLKGDSGSLSSVSDSKYLAFFAERDSGVLVEAAVRFAGRFGVVGCDSGVVGPLGDPNSGTPSLPANV